MPVSVVCLIHSDIMGLKAYYSVLVWVVISLALVRCDIYTAVDGLEKVLHAEISIADELNNYIQNEEKRLETLRAASEEYRRHGEHSLSDIKASLGNPVNAFILVKRLTSDLNKLIPRYTVDEFRVKIEGEARHIPTDQDLVGAANALFRIQDTYKLSSAKMAKGEIQGVKWPANMTAGDCFEVGRIAYVQDDDYHAILWFEEALEILKNERVQTSDKYIILDYLAFSFYKKDNMTEALRLTKELVELDPTNQRLQTNLNNFRRSVEEEETNMGSESKKAEHKNTRKLTGFHDTVEFETYEKLCRGEKTHTDYPWHKLTCQYRRHHPFFYIRPLREEVVYSDPWIAVYHDIMTDSDIEIIRQQALPKLSRSSMFPTTTDDTTYKETRTSKTAWLDDSEHERISVVSRKVELMTNLSLETSEALQVLNYGIGGHYEPHHDFAKAHERSNFNEINGNRIMTVIYYMTDVEAGGATVFPALGVTVWPRKGSCAVWYNLKPNGEGDYLTLHAGCPVLAGSKWVCNKWIHERGQEFVRPCQLDRNQ